MKIFRGKIGFLRLLYWYWRKGFPLRMAWTCDIDVDVLRTLDKSTIFGHPIGIVLGKGTVVGKGCLISQGVTIGAKYPLRETYFLSQNDRKLPVIGDNVFIGANAVLSGNIRVGDNARIGAGTIVLKDVPADMTVVGVWK